MKGYYELDSHFHGNDKIAIKHFVSLCLSGKER